MLIAIPTREGADRDAPIGENLDNCRHFAIAIVENQRIVDIKHLTRPACGDSNSDNLAGRLKDHGVEVIIAAHMNETDLNALQHSGILVFFKESASTVHEAIELFLASRCRLFDASCSGPAERENDHPDDAAERLEIAPGRKVSLEYEIRSSTGQLIDSSKKSGAQVYTHGAGEIMAPVEEALAGHRPGEHLVVKVEAAEAYGLRDESRVLKLERDQLPPDVTVGSVVTAHDQQQRQISLTVVALDEDSAVVDGNHLLAGMDLEFELTVLTVQEPDTPQD